MKAKQINNNRFAGKPVDCGGFANLSPPEDIVVKEWLLCADVRNYSWQDAPLQRLLPLHSGKANIVLLISKQV